MQVKMKPELALIQFAVFNNWAVTLINYQATSYLFYFGNYLRPNIQYNTIQYKSLLALNILQCFSLTNTIHVSVVFRVSSR